MTANWNQTLGALDDALAEQRRALLGGDGEALLASITALQELIDAVGRLDPRLAAAIGAAAPADGGLELDWPDQRRALAQAAARLRASALQNARLLIQARDMTGDLLRALQGARPSLDRSA